MESFGSQRLREFIDYLKSEGKVYNDTDFCCQIDKNRQQVSHLLTGKRPVSTEFALHVANHFPELNFKYLVSAEEKEMLRRSLSEVANKPISFHSRGKLPISREPANDALNKQFDALLNEYVNSDERSERERLLAIIEAQTKQIDQLVQTVVRLTSK